MEDPTFIGRLEEGAETLAWRIQKLLPDVRITVWIQGLNEVYSTPGIHTPESCHSKLVGCYDAGRAAHWIEQDLSAARRS